MASINGRIVSDSNLDNTENDGFGGFDLGIAGQTIQLLDSGGTVIATTTTDPNGTYSFTGLAAGDYRVVFPTTAESQRLATANVGDAAADSDPDPTTGTTPVLTLTDTQDLFEIDAVYGNYIVDGAETGESMPLGYSDAQGDLITDNADTIFGNGGDDTIDAAGGDDFVSGGNGNDVVAGGTGNDNLNGDDGNDSLSGDAGNDQLFGGSGFDALSGGDGNDLLAGGGDNDTLFGDAGNDDLRGEGGDDFLSGGIGDDFLEGGTGNDNVNGDDGNDDLRGDAGDDQMFGGAGIDTLFGGDGNDLLAGGFDNDVLFGDAGNDDLRGEDGDDFLSGGTGDDFLDGGTGNDNVNGDDGNDDLRGDAGDDQLFGGAGIDTLFGGDGNDQLSGGFDNDVLLGDAGNDDLRGEDGDDFISGGTGDDFAEGGAGNDTINGDEGNDDLRGGAGNDQIFGGDGNDTLAGGEGADSLVGGAGADSFALGADDTASGGDGDDIFLVDPSLPTGGNATITGGETGETAGDTLDLRGLGPVDVVYNSSDPTFNPVTGISESGTATYTNTGGDPVTIAFSEIETVLTDADGTVDGTSSADTINVGFIDAQGDRVTEGADTIVTVDGNDSVAAGGGDDSVDAGTGDDFVEGGAGNDTLIGGDGNDALRGDDGNDVLSGDAGNDDLLGGAGDDQMFGGAGDDFMGGQDGNDTLDGGDGADFVAGDDGNDLVQGGAGSDTLVGGAGADTLVGGLGNDFFTADNNFVTTDDPTADAAGDVVFGGAEGTTDLDTLDLRGADVVQIQKEDDPNDPGAVRGVVTFSTGETLTFEGIELILTDAVDGTEAGQFMPVGFADAEGDAITEGADTILGNGGDDDIRAGGGNDVVDGGAGNDFVDAGAGDDTVTGGAGNDDLRGGDGNDSLEGGLGDDFLDGDTGDDLVFGGDGNDDMRGSEGNDLLQGGAGNDTLLGEMDNDTLDGGAGADLLEGDIGNDSLIVSANDTASGGDGDDIFTIDQSITDGPGTITITGGEGGETAGDTLVLTGLGPVDITYTGDDPASESGTATYFDANGDLVTINFSEIENFVVCFTRGTLIATDRGEVPVEELTTSDRAITMDDGYQPIRWIGSRNLSGAELAANPKLRPIRIREGALSPNLPVRDLVVSPQHRVLMRSKVTRRMFQTDEVLVPAKALVALHGVEVDEAPDGVEYWHILFDRHQVIFSEGAPTESLFTGPEALKSVSPAAREEIFTLFPELADPDTYGAPLPARPLIPVRRGLKMAERLSMNGKTPLENRV